MRVATLALIVLFVSSESVLADEVAIETLTAFDRDASGALSLSELVDYFLHQDKGLEKARAQGFSDVQLLRFAQDWAVEAIQATCLASPCPPIAVSDAPSVIAAVPRTLVVPEKKPRTRIGWPGLGFKRSVSDPVDPRSWKTGRPFIFSYKHDGEAAEGEKSDQFSFFGGVQLYNRTWDLPRGSAVPNRFWTWAPGFEFDVDGSKPSNETSVTLSTPLSYEFIRRGEKGFFSSHTVSFSPKFITDRDFDREVWELAVGWSFSSEPLHSGYYHFFGSGNDPKKLNRIAWQPSFTLAAGDVKDAAGNEKLAVLAEEGNYLRLRGGISFSFRPSSVADRLTLGFDYKHVYDFEQDFSRGFGEASIQYDLNDAGAVQLTLVYRKGRKEPDFAKKDELIFGIGLFQ